MDMSKVAAGRIITILVVTALIADAAVNLFAPELTLPALEKTGFPINLSPILATIIIICAVTYEVPATALLGAVLVTGFLGGAICAHFRLGEMGSPPPLISRLLGVAT